MYPLLFFWTITHATQKLTTTHLGMLYGLDQSDDTSSTQRATGTHVARHNGLDQPDPTFPAQRATTPHVARHNDLDQPDPTFSSRRSTRTHVARHNGLDQPDPTISFFESLDEIERLRGQLHREGEDKNEDETGDEEETHDAEPSYRDTSGRGRPGSEEDNPISIDSDDETQPIDVNQACPSPNNTSPTPDVPAQIPASSGPLSDGPGTAESAGSPTPPTFQDDGTSGESDDPRVNMGNLFPRVIELVRDALNWDKHLKSFQAMQARQEQGILLLKEELSQKDQEIARLRQNEALYMRKDAMMESFRAIEARQEGDASLLKAELAQRDQEIDRLSQEIVQLKQNKVLYMKKDTVLESLMAMEARHDGDISSLKERLAQRDQENTQLGQEIAQLKQNEALYMRHGAVDEVPSLESFLALEKRQGEDISLLKEQLAQTNQKLAQTNQETSQTNQELARKSQQIDQLKQNEAQYMRKDALDELPSSERFLVMEARQEEDISFVRKGLAQNSQEITQLKQNEMLYMRRDAVDGVPSSSHNSHALETMLRHVMDRLDAVEQKYPTLPKEAQAMTRGAVKEKPNSSINVELLQALVKNAQRRLEVVEDRYAILQNEFVALQSSLGNLEADRAMVGIPDNVSRRLEVVEARYATLENEFAQLRGALGNPEAGKAMGIPHQNLQEPRGHPYRAHNHVQRFIQPREPYYYSGSI
ncbi:hypothetical protein ASPCAL02252 [Aspergillus calidoustus]|uniref:Uncharacterized protein n=1 Tax=Aspergillus calidoustus TaxID=454130 RepID=A0A0U5CMD7_ASPCI|nr:hypothetical protein ASPCAL02252 [Aspergillus calidoustus]